MTEPQREDHAHCPLVMHPCVTAGADTYPAGDPPPARASDADRDHVIERLKSEFAAGRLTLPELEERVTTAYRAGTRPELDRLTGDLPGESSPPTDDLAALLRPDVCLLVVLLCVCPPAGLAYWYFYLRRAPQT